MRSMSKQELIQQLGYLIEFSQNEIYYNRKLIGLANQCKSKRELERKAKDMINRIPFLEVKEVVEATINNLIL